MPETLTLSRAARLAGVTRAELQKKIRRGDITTFEGEVAISDLLRVYPSVTLEKTGMLEQVERIKADAVPRSHDADAVLPDPEVLFSRLKSLSKVLEGKVAALNAAETLLDTVTEQLSALTDGRGDAQSDRLREMLAWLTDERAREAVEPLVDARAQLFASDTFMRIMSANVKIIPSGHDFFVDGTESILDASVRAGLKMSYGCSSGNCGDCKARVLSGEVWKMREHDYVLSQREKQMGYVLTCSNTAVTDIVIEAAEAMSVDDLPEQQIRAGVRKIERLSPDLVLLHIQTPRTQTLRFMAGQRAWLTVENGGSAEIPIASCPCNGRNLLFYIRREPGDALSEYVFDGLQAGQMVELKGPTGRFVLDEDSPDPAVFIAFGDAIAPIKSLIEHAVSIDIIDSFYLYWTTCQPEGHHQGQWGRALKDALDNFSFTPLCTDSVGDVLATVLSDHPEPAQRRYYLAGGDNQVLELAEALQQHGVDPSRIAIESLW